jgi:hypothetical protein
VVRKQIIAGPPGAPESPGILRPESRDIAGLATVLLTSESADHPVDHLFDGRDGPGGTRWVAAAPGEQTLILAFDAPQTIREVSIETEERHASRTQVLVLSLSRDGGRAYREVLRQEFTFSPPSTTFQREEWSVPAEGVTHLRLVIQPDKGHAPHQATLTSFAIR